MFVLLRRIRNQPVIYGIKILGLALGIAIATLIFVYINFESGYDKFHAESDDIYRLVIHSTNSSEGYARTAPAYIPAFKNELPGLVAGFRIKKSTGYAEYENQKFKEENIYFVDNEIFDVLSIPLTKGNQKTALQRPNTVVINREAKEKYFGSQPAIGKIILLNGERPLEVTGIFNDYPKQSHLNPEFLVSLKTYESIRGADLDQIWQENIYYSYVKLQDKQAYKYITENLDEFVASHYQSDSNDERNFELSLQPITSIHLSSHLLYEISPNSNKSNIYFLITVALLILLISVVNFINITTVVVQERFEEAGVRKILGATPRKLIIQHLFETGSLSYLSACIAVILIGVVQPLYTNLTSISLDLEYFIFSPVSYLFLFLPIGIALLAGLYPAVTFAGFAPALRSGKSETSRGDSMLRNSLVVFQFCISLILVITTLLIYKQMNYVQNFNYGFNEEGVVVLPYVGPKYDLLKDEVSNITSVTNIAASGDIPGSMGTTLIYEAEGSGPEKSGSITTLLADQDFTETYDIELIAGRDFRRGAADLHNAIILNREAVQNLGWTPEDAIGKRFKLEPYGNEGRIIGVSENFHVYSLHKELEPVAMANWPEWFAHVSVRIQKQNIGKALNQIESIWNRVEIAEPFDFVFLDRSFEEQYRSDVIFRKIFFVFSILAILIACLGLFGLILHKTKSMEKEISIRKVLGASTKNLSLLIVGHTYMLFGIAVILAIPLSYWAIQQWMKDFSYRTEIGIAPFLGGSLLLLAIITATILYHTLKAALQNPVIGLRNDQ